MCTDTYGCKATVVCLAVILDSPLHLDLMYQPERPREGLCGLYRQCEVRLHI